ncbi:hypothetical protein DXG01_015139 [Tephrocybe rancida]|nr:hypothetical protein DXG01_015139 [Tephrocybe rancida]
MSSLRFRPIPPQNETDYDDYRTGSRALSLPSAAFGQTLQFITSAKLRELEKQRLAYEAHSAVLEKAASLKDQPLQRAELLLGAVRAWSGSGAVKADAVIGDSLQLSNLEIWLVQAHKNPTFSQEVINSWADILERHIRHSLVKFESARLFGNLFTEWLASGDSITAVEASPVTVLDPHIMEEVTEFIEMERKEMYEQMARLKSLVSTPPAIDTNALVAYLSSLFSDENGKTLLDDFRKGIKEFGDHLRTTQITVDDVRWTIQSILSSDLLLADKRATLRELIDNPTVLEELANVLNMRLGTLESWSWPVEGVLVDMRRHLNGKYRAYTDPEILDALFLEYIGTLWQVKFKQDFKDVFSSDLWKPSIDPATRIEKSRRQTFLGTSSGTGNIEASRKALREEFFLAGQLATSADSRPVYDENAGAGPRGNPASIKQTLLHAMTTDCYLNKTLHGAHTVVRTDLEWFGPSLPHASILAVLSFFGVTQEWIDFFTVFLRMPVRFNDDPPNTVNIRERGTPISYSLSAVCGEVILFGMDLAVNQGADGLFLYRIHDDLWFWNADSDKCCAAWKEMNTYTKLVGLTFNASKTGSACVGAVLDPRLPAGEIRWGFLVLDHSTGRFVIDQAQINEHIVELRRQLASTKSVLGWINAYNKYMAFILRNLGGRPAACFGREHADAILDTMATIQRDALLDSKDGAVEFLRSTIAARFGAHDLPQGYFYLPIGNGGLALLDPMVEILSVYKALEPLPEGRFQKQADRDAKEYQAKKEEWEARAPPSTTYYYPPSEFLSFEEYSAYRETALETWRTQHEFLMTVPTPALPAYTPAISASLTNVAQQPRGYYERWILATYSKEVLSKFGSFEMVDPSLIPVGLVQLYKASRLKWEQ